MQESSNNRLAEITWLVVPILVAMGFFFSPLFFGLAAVSAGIITFEHSKTSSYLFIALGAIIVLGYLGASFGERMALRDNAVIASSTAN